MSDEFPTPLEIKALAEDYSYVERRSEVNYTLFFTEDNPEQDGQPILINVFYTTRGIMTKLPHPTQGYNELWRRTAYDSLESLAMLFDDPRTHTGKGYRQAKHAVSGCSKCGLQKKKNDYSLSQWKRGAGKCVCKDCISGESKGDTVDDGEGQQGLRLTTEALEQHNRLTIKNENKTLERRQFNCPVCPKEGRGKHVFFKRVPEMKPICKCPKCKKIKQGDCERLYPIPKGEEKGYGHYRCKGCKSTWGSSRAIANVGQECHACNLAGKPNVFSKPFRVEVYKSGYKGGITGGGARPAGRRMKRVPKEPINEDSATDGTYSSADAQRFQANGGGGTGGGSTTTTSFDWQVINEEKAEEETAPLNSRLAQYKPAHKCEGCATGICRSRKLPISGVHDLHDGDTASTSGSIMTNSVVDKSEFPDRDIDFDDWDDDDDGSDVYVTVGKNGKILRG